jgi:hypothetical protein
VHPESLAVPARGIPPSSDCALVKGYCTALTHHQLQQHRMPHMPKATTDQQAPDCSSIVCS